MCTYRSLAKTGEPSNDLDSPAAHATHIYTSPTLLPLTKKQRRLVTKNPGAIVAIAKGARMAVEECQNQFKDRRWNCPVQELGHGRNLFGKIIEKGKRILKVCTSTNKGLEVTYIVKVFVVNIRSSLFIIKIINMCKICVHVIDIH